MARNEKVQYTLSLKDAFSSKMNDANESVDRFNKDAEEGTKRSKGFSEGLKNIAAAGAAIAGSLGLREMVQDLRETAKAQTEIRTATGATGAELDDLTTQARALGSAVQADSKDITQAANAIEESFGIEFQEAMDLIESGFKRGANANGDLLEQVKEYSPVLQSMGVSAQEFFGIIAESGQAGLFSDKGIDSIKEFQNSLGDLNEEGNDVAKALNEIGVDENQIKELFNAGEGMAAVQQISQAITGLGDKAQEQNIISRIFRGPGEDAGREFFELMANGTRDLKNLPETISPLDNAFFELDKTITNVRQSISNTFSGVFQTAVEIMQEFQGEIISAAKALLLIGGVGGAIFAVTRAVTALNAALAANPIGLVIAAIAALTAGLVFLFQENEMFRESVLSLWETIKTALNPVIVQLKNLFDLLKPALVVLGQILMGSLIGAIKLLEGAFIVLGVAIRGIIAFFKNIIDITKAYYSFIGDLIVRLIEFLGFKDEFEDLKEAFNDIFDFDAIVAKIRNGLADISLQIAEWASAAGFGGVAEAFNEAADLARPDNPMKQSGRDEFNRQADLAASRFAFQTGEASNRGESESTKAVKDLTSTIKQGASLSRIGGMGSSELGGGITNMSSTGESSSVSGTVRSSSAGSRKITVNINNLVETFNITAANIEESAERTRDEIARALTAAITDSAIVTTN